MGNTSLYVLWLPKYFDEYYSINNNKIIAEPFLKVLQKFLNKNDYIENCKLSIYNKNIHKNITTEHINVSFSSVENSIGYWGKIIFNCKNSSQKGQVIFSEFGFYYFEFTNTSIAQEHSEKEIIKAFFQGGELQYPLLTETQKDVLKETFLNDHLDYNEFNNKYKESEKKIKIEDFVLEAIYKVHEKDIDIDNNSIGKTIQNKILKLTEYKYEVKEDEYYNLITLERQGEEFKEKKEKIESFFTRHSNHTPDKNMYKKVLLDVYEEQAISQFLTTVVSVKYFDRITKSIKEVREGLTGKIIYMTPEDTSILDSKFKNNTVFKSWSEEQIENYVQLLISKKPLFTKIDNALKSAYYITIGNVTSLGHIDEKEDISQLLHYHEWQSLLAYFSETTKSLNDILSLYRSNKTNKELDEIKHYESNNHDKDDIALLIKSNEKKSESPENTIMMIAITVTMLMALPDIIGSIGEFPKAFKPYKMLLWGKEWIPFFESFSFLKGCTLSQSSSATLFYIIFFSIGFYFLGVFKVFKIIFQSHNENRRQKRIKYIRSSSDDFDILEHRSNMPVRSFNESSQKYKKESIHYDEHISTHRFVRYIEALSVKICKKDNCKYNLLPELVSIEGLEEKNPKLYEHIKEHRTTKFSVNRIDKTKIKVSMRYRVNKIKIENFLDYYLKSDSYASFYNNHYSAHSQRENFKAVVDKVRRDFKGINAELSFVAIYSFSLISKRLTNNREKEFDLHKDSFRVYFHIDKYPNKYYKDTFNETNNLNNKQKLIPYDALSEMIYLVFLGRLKGYNYDDNIE